MFKSASGKKEGYKIHFSNPPFLVKMCGEFKPISPHTQINHRINNDKRN